MYALLQGKSCHAWGPATCVGKQQGTPWPAATERGAYTHSCTRYNTTVKQHPNCVTVCRCNQCLCVCWQQAGQPTLATSAAAAAPHRAAAVGQQRRQLPHPHEEPSLDCAAMHARPAQLAHRIVLKPHPLGQQPCTCTTVGHWRGQAGQCPHSGKPPGKASGQKLPPTTPAASTLPTKSTRQAAQKALANRLVDFHTPRVSSWPTQHCSSQHHGGTHTRIVQSPLAPPGCGAAPHPSTGGVLAGRGFKNGGSPSKLLPRAAGENKHSGVYVPARPGRHTTQNMTHGRGSCGEQTDRDRQTHRRADPHTQAPAGTVLFATVGLQSPHLAASRPPRLSRSVQLMHIA